MNSSSMEHPVGGYAVQAVEAPLTRSAVFLVLVVNDGDTAMDTVRDVLTDLDGLVKTVGFRDLDSVLHCTVGIGARVWTRLTGHDKPAELHPFRQITGATHTAIGTPGDLLFHLRADRQDLCFELERLLMAKLGSSVTTADEVSAFRYFDTRDLLGFVDGTANPIGDDLRESILVGDEDPEFAGGSYVLVQKYVHPLTDWEALSTEQQETIMGRTKMDNIELDDAVTGQKSHKTLTTITDDEGEHDIVRDNMPFGEPGSDTFGTYFIGYSARLWVIERMLERMFIGDPPGTHDRLLDFSVPKTGSTFFVPTAAMLAGLTPPQDTAPDAPPEPSESDPIPSGAGDQSLGIGSLRDVPAPR